MTTREQKILGKYAMWQVQPKARVAHDSRAANCTACGGCSSCNGGSNGCGGCAQGN